MQPMTVNKEKAREKEKKIPILIEVTRSPQAISRSPILLAVTPLPRPLTTQPVTNMYFIFSFCFWFNSFQTKHYQHTKCERREKCNFVHNDGLYKVSTFSNFLLFFLGFFFFSQKRKKDFVFAFG
jgi:hypothetical protein